MTGYMTQPALSAEHLAFVSEDALWIASRDGGLPRRLTSGNEVVRHPCFSRDGCVVAFDSDFEGSHQIYSVPIEGGTPRRLTHEGAHCAMVGFRPNGALVFRSQGMGPLRYSPALWEMAPDGSNPTRIPVGRSLTIDFAADDDLVVLGRNQLSSAAWKRYRGGRAGDVWMGSLKEQSFRRLIEIDGNPVCPVFCRDRVFFIADSDDFGNVWSCRTDGTDLRQHTRHRDFYVRNLRAFGDELVYQKGGDLFRFDTTNDTEIPICLETHPGGVHLQRKFVSATDQLQELDFSPDGRSLVATVRGKALGMKAWGGPVYGMGKRSGVRYRVPRWLKGNREIITVSDEGGEESLEVYEIGQDEPTQTLRLAGVQRVAGIFPNPAYRSVIAVADITGRLLVVDLDHDEEPIVVATSQFGKVTDVTWSADGRWLAFVVPVFWLLDGGIVHLYDLETGDDVSLTTDELPTHTPAFDPEGKFLYVLSERTFNPVLDAVHFSASCQQATRLYAYVLAQDGISPFDPRWPELQEDLEKEKEKQAAKKEKDGEDEGPDHPPTVVDVDGLENRLVEFPDIGPGIYSHLQAAPGKILYLAWPMVGLLDQDNWTEEPDESHLAELVSYDLKAGKQTTIATEVKDFVVRGEKTLIRTSEGVRILKTGEEPPEDGPSGYNRGSGWVDMRRMSAELVPADEWKQMFTEAWRLQRHHFWTEDMAGVDWPGVLQRYLPLLDRVATRGELSDLIWEMQGELGTSHAYEFGGDYPERRSYPVGLLGADFAWDGRGYRIEKILEGDAWRQDASSPLVAPGVNVCEGDRILAINGRVVSESLPPGALLVHEVETDVELLVETPGEESPQTVVVRTLKNEFPLRYRDWVNRNRAMVASRSGGRVGYLHIPDMGGHGLAEFLRAFRSQSKHAALVVDLRDNGGGFVSPLILDYLRRKVIGYERPRYGVAETYPPEAVRGPIVGIIDQFAGSDGDVISHAFRAYDIGPLVGKRTWGGVIGISMEGVLADGTIATQPEYACCFQGVGWGIENRGIEPDIEVEFDPASEAAGEDPQLLCAVETALEYLARNPVERPVWPETPSRRVSTTGLDPLRS